MITIIDMDHYFNVEEYIGNDYYKSLYLYLNLCKYGLNSDAVKVYRQVVEGDTKCVLLKYRTTLHIMAKDENEVDIVEVSRFFNNNQFSMLCGTEEIINRFYDVVEKERFVSEIGFIRELTSLEQNVDRENIYIASGDELQEVADLVLKDPDIANTYTKEELYGQIRERNDDGYGRDYVIKMDGKMVAHAGTGAENKNLAVVNYIIVDPDYRRQGLAYRLVNALCDDLTKEGKKCYLVNYTNESTGLYDKVGFKLKCRYGKCYLKRGNND